MSGQAGRAARWVLSGPAGRSREALAVAVALGLDRLLGDPVDRWHPVAWFGALMSWRERRAWRDSRSAGAVHALAGVAVAVAVARLAAVGAALAPGGSAVATAVLTNLVIGGRSLDRAAAAVGAALDRGDIEGARRLLRSLAGRDPAGLGAGEICRAVVESVAENTVDAVVAPVLWAAAGGPVGAAAYRSVNTLDAMVGYRDERYRNFGWASARLDDLANLVPARAAALTVAAVRPRRAAAVWTATRRDGPSHPSPNAGVAEAAFAGALGVRLGGVNVYAGHCERRAFLGDGAPPVIADIARARALARDVSLALGVVLVAPAALGALRRLPDDRPGDDLRFSVGGAP